MSAQPKPWHQSKTLWVQIVTLLAGILTAVAGSDLVAEHPEALGLALTALAAVNAVLRFLTSKPIKGTPADKAPRSRRVWPVLLVCLLGAGGTAHAQTVVMHNGRPAKILFADGDTVRCLDVRQVVTLDGDTPTPTPPTDEQLGLVTFTQTALAQVPEHAKKQAAAEALAAIFQVTGEQYAAGAIPPEKLFGTLEQAMDATLGALQVEQHWRQFRAAVKAEINRLGLQPSQVPQAFTEIADGLRGNAAVVDLIPHVLALIQALQSGDMAAVAVAVLRIVTALLGAGMGVR